MRTHTRTHTYEFHLCADDAVLQLCEAHTHGIAGVFFLSLPSFSFSTEQAKSRGSAGLWRVEAANFLWALWSPAACPGRLNQWWKLGVYGSKHHWEVWLWTRGQICVSSLFFFFFLYHRNPIRLSKTVTFEVNWDWSWKLLKNTN